MPPAIVTGYTAAKMEEILSNVIKGLSVDGTSGHLLATLYDDSVVDLGLVKGGKGDKGDTGAPGTAGIWYTDTTPQAQTLDDPTTYKNVGTIVIPTASYARKVVLWSKLSLVALSTGLNVVYRAAIRDNTTGTPATIAHTPWYCTAAGLSGGIPVVTEPIDIAANQGKTFLHSVRRDNGASATNLGTTDGDPLITKFTALVTAA